MVIIGNFRPKGIQIQIKDTLSKESKSFTVHGLSMDKVFYNLLHYAQQLTKYDKIKLVCYKEESKNDETIKP